jgi:nucleotide-binding universal stress UspA family protein
MPLPPEAGGSAEQPVVFPGESPDAGTGPVVVALDDDGNAGVVLEQARAMATRLGVALRATYVWTDCRPPDCPHHRRCHRDLGEASQLLTELLDEHLAIDDAAAIERDVVHGADLAEALAALGDAASVLVVGASADGPKTDDELGGTARALIGRTRCPVVVVPRQRRPGTW